MEILSMAKGLNIKLDDWFDAFRKMTRENITKTSITRDIRTKGLVTYVFTLSNPVENVWFVHAYTTAGVQVGSSKFDQFDL